MEILDIVNEHDEVIGHAPRGEVYANKHPHRIVHVLVFNDKGEMALQLRSKHVSYRPLHWVTTAGGHVQSGETYEQAGIRETKEEAHFIPSLTLLGKNDYIDDEQKIPKKLTIFTTTHNGPIEGDPKDVDQIAFFSLEEIRKMLSGNEKFHSELLFILKEYYDIT